MKIDNDWKKNNLEHLSIVKIGKCWAWELRVEGVGWEIQQSVSKGQSNLRAKVFCHTEYSFMKCKKLQTLSVTNEQSKTAKKIARNCLNYTLKQYFQIWPSMSLVGSL